MTNPTDLATATNVGYDLVKALGLEGQLVTGITLRVKAAHLVEVDITREICVGQVAGALEVLDKYMLVPR